METAGGTQPLWISSDVLPVRPLGRLAGQSLVDGFILMRSQVDVVGDLLAWLWGQNMGYLSRLEALLSQDKSFQQIDEICKQLEATQVRVPPPFDSLVTSTPHVSPTCVAGGRRVGGWRGGPHLVRLCG